MMMKKVQLPAKSKYDKAHPVISLRVDPELKSKLEEIKEKSGASIADILKNAVMAKGHVLKSTFALGHNNGFELAKNKYRVTFKCAKCGGNVTLESELAKKHVAIYLRERGMIHSGCQAGTNKNKQ